VAPRCTIRNSRPINVVAAAAVADSDAPEIGVAGLFSSSSSLLLLLLSTRMSADRMADCTHKLQATISAAVES